MINFNRNLWFNSPGADFNRLKPGLKCAQDSNIKMRFTFDKLRMLFTSYLRNPTHFRIDNNTRYRIY